MNQISIFNHVIEPIMHGTSSSHTAGAYHIGKMALSMLGSKPKKVIFPSTKTVLTARYIMNRALTWLLHLE